MNSDVHRHQPLPPLAQGVGGSGGGSAGAGLAGSGAGLAGAGAGLAGSGGACGWYSASTPPAYPPTAPLRVKRLPAAPAAAPSSGGSALSSSVRIPPPPTTHAPTVMHVSQTAGAGAGQGAGPGAGLPGKPEPAPGVAAPNSRLASMAHMPWHHGAISRERAEALLNGAADGVFLVRESTNFPGDHTLCVRYRGRVEHYRVKWATVPGSQAQRLTIDDEEYFDNMNDLIQHYLQDADGLCTVLVRWLGKGAGAAPTPPYVPPPQPHPPPHPHVGVQPTPYPASQAQQTAALHVPPPPACPAPAPASSAAPAAAPAPAPALPQHDQTDSALQPCLAPQAFVDAGWMIPERELEIRENIGKGEFGDVMLGILGGSQRVAVKILKDREAANKFLTEASLMTSLKHENLVRLLGLVFTAGGATCIVTEHMARGSLLDYLRSRGRHHVSHHHQINFAYDACLGMEYLECRRVVHRDLAARNVLISREGVAKVADFGLARATHVPAPAHADSAHHPKLPIKWTAPEALKHNKFSNKSDMWSFGILLWEIYSFGRVPYPRIPLAEVVRHVERGYRMEAPDGCPPEPYELMRAAWHADPAQRPTFRQAVARLAAIRAATPPPPPHLDPHLDWKMEEES